jgi:hypothetical protein
MAIPAIPRRAAPPRRKTPKSPEPAPASVQPMPVSETPTEAAHTLDVAPIAASSPVAAETAAAVVDSTAHKSPEPVDERSVEETSATNEKGDHESAVVVPAIVRQDDPIERAYFASSNPRPESPELDDENIHSTHRLAGQPSIERAPAREDEDSPSKAVDDMAPEEEDEEMRRQPSPSQEEGFATETTLTSHADAHPSVHHGHHDAVGGIEHPATEAEQDLQDAIVEDHGMPIEEIAHEHETATQEQEQEEAKILRSTSSLAVPPPAQTLVRKGSSGSLTSYSVTQLGGGPRPVEEEYEEEDGEY